MENATQMPESLTSFGTASNSTNSYLYRNSTTNSWISMIANHLHKNGGKHWPSRLTITCVLWASKKQGVIDTFYTLCFCSAWKFIFHRKTAVVRSVTRQGTGMWQLPVFTVVEHWTDSIPSDTYFKPAPYHYGFFHCINIYVLLTLADLK